MGHKSSLGGLLLVSLLASACGTGGNMAEPSAPMAPGAAPAPAQASEEDAEGAEPEPPPPPAAQPTLEVSEIDTAERALAEAERELQALSTPPAASDAAGAAAGSEARATRPKDRCQIACRAFASLKRARDAICRIDGEEGERCGRANSIVARHSESTNRCSCEP